MTTASANSHNDIARLVAVSRHYAMLKVERERELVARWRAHGDRNALAELVGSHLRLVIRIARDNRGYGLPLSDLIGEGNVGLMEAANRFDPERGARFATYARWWVRTLVLDYILRNWSAVRMGTTPAQKKLFFNLGRAKRDLEAGAADGLSHDTAAGIAARLRVPLGDVVEMNQRMAQRDLSLNATFDADRETEHQDMLVDTTPDQETVAAEVEEWRKRRPLLQQALCCLGPRERQIFSERRLAEHPKSLRELAAAYGVSPERIRQIENRAASKLAGEVLAAAAACGLVAPASTDMLRLHAAA